MPNSVSDNEILDFLENKYLLAIQEYGERKILGVFPTGKINYGFADSVEECMITTIYVPDFEELCIGSPKKEVFKDMRVMDIRMFYDSIVNEDVVALEFLFSDYNIINPYYEELFNSCFIEPRETIAKYNPQLKIKRSRRRAAAAVEQGNLFEAARINIACREFLSGTPCYNCYKFKKEFLVSYLESVKRGAIFPDGKELLGELYEMEQQAEDVFSPEALTLVKTGILKIMDISLYKEIDMEAFLASLTNNELEALKLILKTLKGETAGLVSISVLVEESGISRPVFKNLIVKMENFGIVKTTNRGVKGMYFEFLEKNIQKKVK